MIIFMRMQQQQQKIFKPSMTSVLKFKDSKYPDKVFWNLTLASNPSCKALSSLIILGEMLCPRNISHNADRPNKCFLTQVYKRFVDCVASEHAIFCQEPGN